MEFKVCVGTTNRFNQLRNKIYEKLFNDPKPRETADTAFISYNKETGICCYSNPETFVKRPEPELTFDQAMKLLDEIEPELPFKFGDDVLVRDCGNDCWVWRKFARFEADWQFPFIVNSSRYCEIAKLKGNEHLIMTHQTPDEYWVVKNGELKKVENTK